MDIRLLTPWDFVGFAAFKATVLCSYAFVGFVAFSISRFTIAISDQTALFLVLDWRCLDPAGFEEAAVLGAYRVAFSSSRFTITISDQAALFLVLARRCLEPADF